MIRMILVVGGIGVAPIESEDDGFTARSAAAYGITSQMVRISVSPISPHGRAGKI